ncbi:hypothetical protein GR212_15580 [Rhizobium lusitanum]|uniref:Uncharacterized protein n=1 Tax=Rhizobium lusitanum TaxID=293958 RepID=A0A6L9U6G3_9HYPH|nr:hypothetical protein [Rhizobium lusitanum]NEI70999.1 hypothetical protein [Rhizobium lusitanum]
MTKMLTASERHSFAVNLDDYLPRREAVGKHAAPFSKTEDGRQRRDARRKAIARKREFLS